MMARLLTALFLCTGLLVGCAPEEPPPRTVTEFLDNPMLLDAAMVRCGADRAGSRYDKECINAREAVRIVQAREEAARRAEFEAESERKRQALRRQQEDAAEARRQAEEAERRRKEAEYLAQFGVQLPPEQDQPEDVLAGGNLPIAVVPEPGDTPNETDSDVVLPTAGSNAPVAEPAPEPDTVVEPEREAEDQGS